MKQGRFFEIPVSTYRAVQDKLQSRRIKCHSCSVPMSMGYVPDLHHEGSETFLRWFEGPVEDTWTGQSLKTRGKKVYFVIHFRCPKCSLLQEYAFDPDEFVFVDSF